MGTLKNLAVAGVVVSAVLLAGGCASRYDDDYYGPNGYHDRNDRTQYWHDHTRDRSDDRSDRYDRDDRRVRVCDADGDDCHWEYRRP